ncbi:MAG: ribosome-associated translation inhibitor RaiA [Candidatus Hydrogenedentes bacterium]|nr:ribosome-associated translation inhibitor RaiA [Candidatus Hydrogenedentota bacterium]
MRVAIAARHLDLTDALRSHVESRLDKVRHHFDRVIDVDVVLSVEKHRHTADVTVHANGIRMHGKETSQDMYTSVDTAVGKIDKQILKFKDRKHRFQPRNGKVAEVALEIFDVPIEERSTQAAPGEHKQIVHEPIGMKPMSVEEAALQLELNQDSFLVFRNAQTQEVNVVYAKNDGTIGHIDPE